MAGLNASTFYIEHLIVGTVALTGFVLLLPAGTVEWISDRNVAQFLTLVPFAYIAGLVIEAVGAIPEEGLRLAYREELKTPQLIRRMVAGASGQAGTPEEQNDLSRTLVIIAWNADVGAELRLRRSRDRIARGAFVVAVALAVLVDRAALAEFLGRATPLAVPPGVTAITAIRAAAPVFLGLIWIVLHRQTRVFKDGAYALAYAERKRSDKADAIRP